MSSGEQEAGSSCHCLLGGREYPSLPAGRECRRRMMKGLEEKSQGFLARHFNTNFDIGTYNVSR